MITTKLKKPIVVISITLIIAFSMLCLFGNQLLFQGCLWWECAPKRSFTVFDLNLSKDFFSSNAEIHDLHLLRGDNVAVEAASTTNFWDNGSAIYIVRRFATEAQAIQHYNFDVQVKFTKRPNNNAEYSDIVTYQSKNANSSSTQCGYVINDFRCIYVARYREFTIFFNSSIGENEMAKDDFLGAIMSIDDTIGNLLMASSK